jgi:hypothetical protein
MDKNETCWTVLMRNFHAEVCSVSLSDPRDEMTSGEGAEKTYDLIISMYCLLFCLCGTYEKGLKVKPLVLVTSTWHLKYWYYLVSKI